MKKKYIITLLFLVLFLLIFVLQERIMCFVWVNPYTETSGFPYIAKTLKALDSILNSTEYSLLFDGKRINYIYKNPYGSGFLKNNPIPNDLDFAVGVNLGTYNYNGQNSREIATEIVDKMNSFYLQFTSATFSVQDSTMYPTMSSFDIIDAFNKTKNMHISDIADNLENVINNKPYIKYTKVSGYDNVKFDLTMPYLMEPDSILIQQSKQLKMYTDSISYNDNMLSYLRELSVVPEFYVTIIFDKKAYQFELVTEIFPGTRLQLVRRCFGSTVFNSFGSLNFIKKVEWLNNDDKYIYTRLLSFRRHVEEIENIRLLGKSPVKILKRIMQSAEMVKPLLKENDYNMIVDFVKTNFDNRDIRLLNETQNIYSILCDIISNPNLFNNLSHTDKIKIMYANLEDINNELDQRGNVNKSVIRELEKTNKFVKESILKARTHKALNMEYPEVKTIKDKVEKLVVGEMYSLLYKPESINNIIAIYSKIYKDAGFYKVRFVWLDVNRIGILEDNFTKNIKDFKKFAKENNLVEDIEYTLVNPSKLRKNKYNVTFVRWVQNDLSPEEQAGYEHMKNVLLKDRENFKPKVKWLFVK